MRLGRVTPALGEGVVMLRLLAGQTAGPLGPRGDPDVVCFQLVASRSGRRRLGRPQGGTKGPPQGLLRVGEGEQGPSVPQAAGFREQNGLQGGPSKHQHAGLPLRPHSSGNGLQGVVVGGSVD